MHLPLIRFSMIKFVGILQNLKQYCFATLLCKNNISNLSRRTRTTDCCFQPIYGRKQLLLWLGENCFLSGMMPCLLGWMAAKWRLQNCVLLMPLWHKLLFATLNSDKWFVLLYLKHLRLTHLILFNVLLKVYFCQNFRRQIYVANPEIYCRSRIMSDYAHVRCKP